MTMESEVLAGIFAYPRLILARGQGSWVWDEAGAKYLDFTAGLAVMALGHGDARVAEILARQYAELGHTSNLFGTKKQVELAERLKAISFASRVWFANSGTEANEAALKFARVFGRKKSERKTAYIAFEHGFHGRTMGALSVTEHAAYREPFAPLIPGARFAKFNDLASVDALLDDDVCAVIVEPVQGEGGVLPATQAFLAGLRERCDRVGAALIFDEVQCGLGRVGLPFAYQHYGVSPDVMTLAKPIAAGLPLGAVLINEAVATVLAPGQHGSTFAGGPVVCAVALHVLERVLEPSFLARVHTAGERLAKGLRAIADSSPMFKTARGLGLMQALVVDPKNSVTPADIVTLARKRGLLVTRAGDDAVRLLPPLNTTDEEIDFALSRLTEVVRELDASKKQTVARADESSARA